MSAISTEKMRLSLSGFALARLVLRRALPALLIGELGPEKIEPAWPARAAATVAWTSLSESAFLAGHRLGLLCTRLPGLVVEDDFVSA